MDRITSRKNRVITHFRQLGRDAAYRSASGEFLCDGKKLLEEAIACKAEIGTILWKEPMPEKLKAVSASHLSIPAELFDYVSPMVNSPGPLFTVRFGNTADEKVPRSAMILENVQDPGNVGTVIRTANAFHIDAVILAGACADPYHPRTVRATMGAIFRQNILCVSVEELKTLLHRWKLPVYGAVLSERAKSVLHCDLSVCAVAVGSEGRGLSDELRSLCDGEVIIPMQPYSESLNAAVAASILMWEMRRGRL